jgi:preprotein translocase subunit SecD
MQRRLWITLLLTVLSVAGLLVANVASGNTPVLGLDLQGGVSVILAPKEPATTDDLVVIRDLIRDELERRGIAEPDVRVQGDTIVVDLPGVKDQQEALDAVDVSGVVELRPVLNFSDCPSPTTETTPTEVVEGSEDPATTDAPAPAGDEPVTTDGSVPTNGDETSSTQPAGFRRSAPDTTPVDTSGATLPVDSTTTGDTVPADLPDLTTLDPTAAPTTPGAELLPTRDGSVLCAGPAQGTGEVFERGSAEVTGDLGWGVAVSLRGDGQAQWNNLASQCYNMLPTCPSTQPNVRGQIAIVLDGEVQSSPQVNEPNFGDSVAITGDFTRDEASSLASVLNRGAFPVEVEAQEARTVSASAGSDSLQAAIIAGLIGVALVLAFLIAYYRWIALIVIGGLIIWGMTVYSAAALVSGWTNYALSLAGITGIIVAVGVTVDSYVVFFERMKDEIRNGRTLRNAAPRSFKVTWRTIWTADLVSVLGAAILFWLSVGSVRGFALYLGLTTLCDLFVCYFFTRPAVILLSRSNFMVGKRAFGLEVAT